MTFIPVRETFFRPDFDEPIRRHYLVRAKTPQIAMKAIREMRYSLHGILYGSVPGSKIEVIS